MAYAWVFGRNAAVNNQVGFLDIPEAMVTTLVAAGDAYRTYDRFAYMEPEPPPAPPETEGQPERRAGTKPPGMGVALPAPPPHRDRDRDDDRDDDNQTPPRRGPGRPPKRAN